MGPAFRDFAEAGAVYSIQDEHSESVGSLWGPIEFAAYG
jgi:hypothetical protein